MDGDDRMAESKGRSYRLMTLPDFRKFRALALSDDASWSTHYTDSQLTVQSKPPGDGSTSLNIIRAKRIMENVPPIVLYNQLHDAQYRATWDKNMIEGYNIVQLDPHNDIGYYAAKFPWPLSNRDFCNMRSWMEFTNGEFIIFNHSEPHGDCPEKKGFVRARSILTGFYMRPYNGGVGTELLYVTHSDPCGSIPHSIINFAMTKGAKMILNNCEKCSEQYPAYAEETYPPGHTFPWRTPQMDWDSPYLLPEEVPKSGAGASNAHVDASDEPICSGRIVGLPNESAPCGNGNFLREAPKTHETTISLAPVAPFITTDLLAVQQYRCIMQDTLDAVDRSFLREGRVPTTHDYILRVKYALGGVRQTNIGA